MAPPVLLFLLGTCFLPLLAPAPGPAEAQKRGRAQAPRLEKFLGTFEEAQVSAHDRNVPVVVIAILEDPEADIVQMRDAVLTDRDLAQASSLCVLLLANNGLHPLEEVTEEIDGQSVTHEVCSVYRTPGCSGHQKPFDEIYANFHVDGELVLPLVAVLTPDRELQTNHSDGSAPTVSSIVKWVESAQKKSGEGLTVDGLARVRGLLTRGDQELAARKWGDAWHSFAGVLEVTTKTRYADQARVHQTQALGSLESWRTEALTLLEEGKIIEGYRRLVDLATGAVDTPLEDEVTKLLKATERDKRYKEAIAAYKRELEAVAMLAEAEALFASGDTRKGEGKIRLLFRKFAGTEAAADARERWPHLAPEAKDGAAPQPAGRAGS